MEGEILKAPRGGEGFRKKAKIKTISIIKSQPGEGEKVDRVESLEVCVSDEEGGAG